MDVITNFTVITNAIIKRVHCILLVASTYNTRVKHLIIMEGRVDKAGTICLLVLELFTYSQSLNVQETSFKVISVCDKDHKRTASIAASYQSLSRLDCTVRCSLTTKCSGINYCNISGISDCELLPNVSSTLSCDDLERKDGCVYLHKVSRQVHFLQCKLTFIFFYFIYLFFMHKNYKLTTVTLPFFSDIT